MNESEKDYRDYVQDIIDAISDIAVFVEGISFDAFLKDRKTSNAVIRSLEVIGEAATKIPESIREKYPSIPWKKMAGMRNKLIHEYFGVDLGIVWQLIQKELGLIPPVMLQILRDLNSQTNKNQ